MYTDAVRSELSQGDIFERVAIYERSGDHERDWVTRVIVLSHDCEIDKPSCRAPLTVRIREPDAYQPDVWDLVKDNRLVNGMYLPAGPSVSEGFVDFRHIHRVRKELLTDDQKVASLTDDARLALAEFLQRFISDAVRSQVTPQR